MNEKTKKIVIGITFVFLVLCILVQSIADNILIRRANTTIDNLTTELGDVRNALTGCRAEVTDSRRTITECHDGIGKVREGLSQQSGTIPDIIQNLKQVRAEIEIMENSLNKFYDKYGCNDNSFDNSNEEGVTEDEDGNTKGL